MIGAQVTELKYVPHIDQFLRWMRISRERLDSETRIAAPARLLKLLLQTVVERQLFSEKFYLETYPDIAESYRTGQLTDLRQHYVEQGYFEGRIGAPVEVDGRYYASLYRDVAEALSRGDLKSAREHYEKAGWAEGRIPSEAMQSEVEKWSSVGGDSGQ
jgi:hypothetical protein